MIGLFVSATTVIKDTGTSEYTSSIDMNNNDILNAKLDGSDVTSGTVDSSRLDSTFESTVTATDFDSGNGAYEINSIANQQGDQDLATTDSPTFAGETLNGNLDMSNNNIDDVASIDGGGDAVQFDNDVRSCKDNNCSYAPYSIYAPDDEWLLNGTLSGATGDYVLMSADYHTYTGKIGSFVFTATGYDGEVNLKYTDSDGTTGFASAEGNSKTVTIESNFDLIIEEPSDGEFSLFYNETSTNIMNFAVKTLATRGATITYKGR